MSAAAEPAPTLNRTLLRIAIACLCITALVAIGALLGGEYGEDEAQISLTTLAIGLYTLAGMAGITATRNPQWSLLGSVQAVVAGVGLVLAVALIWAGWDGDEEGLAQAWGIAGILTLVGAQASVLLGRAVPGERDAIRIVRALTIAAGSLAGLLGIAAIAGESDDDGLLRALGTLGVLNLLGAIVLPIVRRLGPQAVPQRTAPAPRPAQARVLRTGRAPIEDTLAGLRAGGASLLGGPVRSADGGRFALLREEDGSLVVVIEPGS